MGKNSLFFLLALISMFFLSGCVAVKETPVLPHPSDIAQNECVSLCQQEKAKGTDLSDGPCLANPLSVIADTVCDVAHNPRIAVDDLPENQCSAFREGKATKFIEVDAECKQISS